MSIGIDVIDLYLTGKCNYECGYCYGEDERQGHMKREIFDNALTLIKKGNIKTLELCGGEPLISPLFSYAVERARGLNLELILRTNGIYLGKYMRTVVDNFKWVGISLDGTKEINHIMRPDKSRKLTAEEKFYIVIDNIKKLKQLNPNIRILLASVATKINYKNLMDLFDYLVANRIPIDEWKIYQFMDTQFRSLIFNTKFELKNEDFMYLQKEIKQKEGRNNFKIIFREKKTGISGNDCLTITSDGKVKVANEFFGQIGKDSEQSIIEKIKSSNYLKYIILNKRETYG